MNTFARHYARDELALRPDVPGARFWSVGLEHALLTYFEVDANTSFPRHSHVAEQITHVLEGELVFAIDGLAEAIVVRAGEAIAIPSNLPHAVHTRACSARAVDAWSPVPACYAATNAIEHPRGASA